MDVRKAYQFFKKFPATHVFHRLPMHYKQNLIKLKFVDPKPVHYIPEPKEWVKDPETGLKKRVVNVPIPLIYPKQVDEGLWGGEGIIKGFQKRSRRGTRIPHWWCPVLKRTVVYSEILDRHMSVIVTERTLHLIDEAYGFDNYILKTEIQDLRSLLGMKIRKEMLLTLIHKKMYFDDISKQNEVYEKYKQYILPEEEIEWLGLTLSEAMAKQKAIEAAEIKSQYPLKHKFRKELIAYLKETHDSKSLDQESTGLNWISRMNPFATKDKGEN